MDLLVAATVGGKLVKKPLWLKSLRASRTGPDAYRRYGDRASSSGPKLVPPSPRLRPRNVPGSAGTDRDAAARVSDRWLMFGVRSTGCTHRGLVDRKRLSPVGSGLRIQLGQSASPVAETR